MAGEATLRVSLTIRKDNLNYQSNPTGFSATVTGTKGPTPGYVLISTLGTDIDLSKLTQPGLCWMQNLSLVNAVEYGIWDPEIAKFYPLGELLPGECFPLRLSRNLAKEFGSGGTTTGTGVTGPTTNRLRFRAMAASVPVRVEAFEV